MYDRRLDGKTLRFGHAGILMDDSFVMYDHGTDSLWVHVTGTAYFGPLKGKRLKFIPSTVTTWEAWKQRFPQTRVLPGTPRHGSTLGTYDGMRKTRGLGLAVVVRFKAKLYPLDVLAAHPVILFHNGTEAGRGSGANALGHPLNALAWLADQGVLGGRGLKAGDLVTTGLVTPFVYAEPGDQVRADFGALGEVELRFSE